MTGDPTSLARRLVPGGLVTLGTFLLSTCGQDNIVDPPAGGMLAVSPGRLADSAALGSRAVRVMAVAISNVATGDLGWTATRLRASPWLSLGSANGTGPSTLNVAADPTGLTAGMYSDTVVVMATPPARGEARIPIEFVIHPCALGSISLGVEVAGKLDGADCTGPHYAGASADLYSFTGSAGDSVSVELESAEFTPYLILDTATTSSVPPLAQSGTCAYAPGMPCLRYQRLPRSGMFVIEATTAIAGDSGAYRVRLFRPRPPSPVDSLTQLRGDSITAIGTGGVSADAAIVLRGTASDPDGGDSLRLEVEVRPVNEAFLGAATSTGAFVPAGGRAVARVNGLSDNTAYHWRARVVDQTGRASAWTGYGGNPEFAADVSVAIADGPTAPAGLGQFKSDSVAAIAVGGMIDEATAVFKGAVLDPDPDDSVRLDVEVRAVGTPFSGVPTASGAMVASGEVGSVAITGLADNTSYHWQARSVDQSGRASAWSEFGGNLELAPDLNVRIAPTQLVFTVQPGTTLSGAAIAPAVQVAAQDAAGNTLASFTAQITIALGSNPIGGTLAGTRTVDAVAGVGTFTDLRVDRAGSGYTLIATATGLAATSGAFGIVPIPPARLGITTQPSAAAQSGVLLAQQPVIQLQDAAGNAVGQPGDTVRVVIVSGGGALGGTTAVLTDASGVAAFTDLMITGTVGPHTLQFSSTGLAGELSSTVDLTAGPPSQAAVNAGDGQSATAGTAVAVAPSVIVRDASGNPVSGVAVTFAAAPGHGTVSPVTPVLTDASGVAAATSWTLGVMAGTDSVTATTSLALTGSPVVFTATAAVGAPATLTKFSGDNLTGEVGSTLGTPHEVTVLDIHGNPVAGVPVSWEASAGGGSVSPTLGATDLNGRASAVRTLGGAEGIQTTTATATVDGSLTTVTFSITATVGGAAQMSIQAGDNQVDTVGQTLPTPLAVRVADQFNNPVPNVQITWAVLDDGGSVTPLSSLTDENGIATTSWTLGTAMSPTDSVHLVRATGVASPLTFTAFAVPGTVSATQTSVTAFPTVITASSGGSVTTLTVTARDQFGNLIKGKPVVLAATGAGNTLTQPASPTNPSGAATGTLSATAAETKTVTATVDGLAITQLASVLVNPGAAQNLVFVSQPTNVTAGASMTPPVQVEIRDEFANHVTSATNGVALAIATNPNGGALTGGGTVAAVDGVAHFAGLRVDKAGTEYTLAATSTGITGATSTAFTVTAGAVSPAQSTVAAAPGSITAGSGVATITVTARDANGNPIEGATVVLAATGSGNTLTQAVATTDASGVATGTLSATVATSTVVSATIDGTGVTQTAAVTVIPAGVSAAQSTVDAAPTAILASSGTSSATITVTVRDPFGNPIAGATVILAATGSGTTLTQPAATTDASGIATGTLSAIAAGDKVVSATINGTGVTQTAVVTVTPAGVSAAQSTLDAAPEAITASTGASSATITVTARDEFSNPIEGATVVLAASGSGNTLTQPATTTNASGVATGTLSATTAEGKTVFVTINGAVVTQMAAVTVTPAGVSAGQSTVDAAPTAILASSGASSATITVTARDEFSNPIEGATVVLAASGSGNTLTQPATTTNASGVTAGTLSATAAEGKTVSVTINGTGITQTAPVTVTPAAVSAAQSTVTAAPEAITASSGANSATITVTARDEFSNPIEGATVVLAATGTGNTLTQPGTTNASGVATGTLSATVATPRIVSATIDGTGVTQTAAVTVIPAGVSSAQSSVAAAPGSIAAGSGVATITVTARDEFGNPIEGATVVLATTGTGNVLAQPATTTNASGVATGTLSATLAEGKTVSVTINGTGITQTAPVTVTPAGVSAGQSTVTAAPGTITAGNVSATITVTARDQFGNPIEGAAVVLTATGTGNTVTQPGTTSASGVATGTLSATGAGNKVVSATIGGTSITQTATVTVTPAGVSAAQSTMAVAPEAITASSGIATITVTARDAFGNPIEGATVVLAATGSGNTLTQPLGLTSAGGVATGTLSATAAGDKEVSATIAGTGVTQTATVTVTAAVVSALHSTVTASPGTITAGSGVTTITVMARDAFGNPIDDATVQLAATGTGNTLSQPLATNENGVTTGTLSATVAEGKTVSVTIEGTGITQTAAVTVTPAGVSAAQSTVVAAPGSITAGSGTSTITVTARDQFGNPIEGAAVVLTATGTGNTLTQPTTTNASGQATGALSATIAEGKAVSVTIGGTGITQTATVTVTAAGLSAAQSTVTAAPESITAGSGVATITVTARDEFGNPIEGATVVLAGTGSGNTLTQPGTTDASGVATGTLSATAAGDKVVSAMIGGIGVTQTAAVTVTPAGVSAAQSTVATSPGSITAGSGAATITVTARDAFGNPLEGATVVLAATGSGTTLTQPVGPTNASGVATGTLSATALGDKVVSATIAGTGVTQTATVTVTAAGVSAAQSTVAALPGTITVGTGIATIIVTARDAFGNAIEGATVVLAVSGTGNTLTQPGTTTDANGVATGTLSATAAEDKVVSATIATTAVTQTATVTVLPTGVSAAQSIVVAAPTTITASTGASSATITVTARDQFGNPIQGVTVVLATTGSGNNLTQPAQTTDASGQATGTLSATAAEDKVVSATIAGTAVTQTATVTVTAVGVSGAQSTVAASPGSITAGSGVATITVTARDAFGNPVEGATVELAATGDGNTLTPPGTTTNASGQATATLSASTAELKIVSATIDGTGVTQTATVTVEAGEADATQSTVVAAPTTIMASNGASSATITVTARDQFGNPIQGATVVLAATGSGNTLTQPLGLTSASGVATGTLSATVAEGKTVSVTIDGTGVTQTATVTVTVAEVSAAQSTMVASPELIMTGAGVATITVTARDAFGNPIQGATVVLAVTGTGNTLTQPGTTTDPSGVATGTLSATAAGDKVVSATIAGTGVTQTATVTATAAGVSAVQSTVAAAPASITAGSGVATITVTARDAFGNTIEGATVILAASGTGNTLTQPGTTNTNGVATATLSATAAESKTVTATVDGVAITQEASVLVTPAAADHLVFLVQPGSGTAGAIMTPPVEVEIRDEFTNRVTSATSPVTLTIATNPGGGTLTGGGPAAAVDGVASFAGLSVNKAGAGYTLAAASPGLTEATSAPFTVTAGPVSPAQSTVMAAPESVGESELSTITVTARDANDNPIAGATVALAATGSAILLTQPAGPTAADGTATGTLSATLSGTKVVSAVVNGTPIVQTVGVTVQPPPGSVVFVGAGDIGDCEWTTAEATATLLDGIPGTVFTAGDNAYPNGTATDFTNCYEPNWGRHKARTYPSPGNHDYRTSGASAYYAYFGANAGPAGRGYYSYDLGDWHIISLNSEISMNTGSTQEQWLRADLAANTKQCTLAYWHKPLFSSGEHGNLTGSKPLWRALQQYNAEVVVVGHDHNYERFAPQDTIGVADPAGGLRQFVVGTGGTDLRGMNPPIDNSEVQNSTTHGVLKLTLYSSGYEWEFIPIAGQTFTDSGNGSCH